MTDRSKHYKSMVSYRNYLSSASANCFLDLDDFPTARMGVVIPAYKEPLLLRTIQSIAKCDAPTSPVLLLIVINAPEGASDDTVKLHKQNEEELLAFQPPQWLHLCFITLTNVPKRIAGVGYARKVGFDTLVNYYLQRDISDGFMLSMDGDTEVSRNYLKTLTEFYQNHPDCKACTIYFEHQENENKELIRQYELYLRYYKLMLIQNGYPYALHTVGSAMGFSTDAYVKTGGMKPLQAGEDFYFLQKMIPLQHIYEVNSVSVFPSDRCSDRVPFGTGAEMTQYRGHETYKVYHPKAFSEVKRFYLDLPLFYKRDQVSVESLWETSPPSVVKFLFDWKASSKILELSKHCKTIEVFERRFYHIFNAFFYMKFLNFLHETVYEKISIYDAVKVITNHESPLEYLRSQEKQKGDVCLL